MRRMKAVRWCETEGAPKGGGREWEGVGVGGG